MDDKNIEYAYQVLISPELMHSEEFRIWMQNKDNADLFWNLKAAFDNLILNKQDLPDVSEEWSRFCRYANLENDTDKVNDIRKNKTIRTRRILQWSVAASFAILITASTYFLSHIILNVNQPDNTEMLTQVKTLQEERVISSSAIKETPKQIYKTLSTTSGQDTTYVLSDGSRIRLNAESTLRYPVKFNGPTRTVELTGEAYFDISHDKSHPFIVKTKHLQTVVHGTSFNVRAYEDKDIHITLVEGRISVQKNKASRPTYLKPGEDASLLADGSLKVAEVDTDLYTAWTKGYFCFENASLETIMRELGNWYDVNIEFADMETMNQHFDFWADRNQSIEETLLRLEEIGKTRCVYRNNTVTVYNVK